MSVISTVREFLGASSQNPNRGTAKPASNGAYWCNDCSVRIRDVEVDDEGEPTCPECGDGMQFERSAASTGCAC